MKTHRMDSIFTRLIVVYGITLLLLLGGILSFRMISISSPNLEISSEHLREFASMLVDRIGTPPDPDALEHVLLTTGLELRIRGPGGYVFSRRELEPQENSESGLSSLLLLNRNMDYPVTIRRGDWEYSFSEFHSDYRISVYSWLVFLVFILSSIVFNFFIVRRLLSPLHRMYDVALKFGVDDWDQRVRPRGNSELSILGREMDAMAERIVKHINSMHDLLSAVSHELRSPLTRMKLILESIPDKEIRESLNEEIHSLDRLTADLLEQKRLSTQPGILDRSPVNIRSLLEGFRESWKQKGYELSLDSSEDNPAMNVTLDLDSPRTELALRNLVENCIRHAPDSPIHLEAETVGGDRQRGEEHGNRELLLSVRDEGPGIPEDLLERIGEPFLLADVSRTGRRNNGGFGLGMSIVKAVAEAHGGYMSVTNWKPRGLKVSLHFPMD